MHETEEIPMHSDPHPHHPEDAAGALPEVEEIDIAMMRSVADARRPHGAADDDEEEVDDDDIDDDLEPDQEEDITEDLSAATAGMERVRIDEPRGGGGPRDRDAAAAGDDDDASEPDLEPDMEPDMEGSDLEPDMCDVDDDDDGDASEPEMEPDDDALDGADDGGAPVARGAHREDTEGSGGEG